MNHEKLSRAEIDAKVAAIFAEWMAAIAVERGGSNESGDARSIDWSSDVAFRIALRRCPERFTAAEIEWRMELMNPTNPGWYVFRISLGMLLLSGTGLLTALFVKLAFDLPMFWVRCEMVALALFFALQSYAVCRILIFRRKPRRKIPWFPPPRDEPGPGDGGVEPGAGPLVPARPAGDLPTLSAAAEVPREGDPV